MDSSTMTPDQAIRVEALAQAVKHHRPARHVTYGASAETVVKTAREFEKFLLEQVGVKTPTGAPIVAGPGATT